MIRMRRYSGLFFYFFAMMLAGCSGDTDSVMAKYNNDALVRLSDAEARGLDPQKFSDLSSLRVARDQFEGLTRFDGTGRAIAGLAMQWTISKDGRRWAFTLRDRLKFSDGQPITAQLFVALWDRLNDPATASPHRSLFTIIQSVAAPDNQTVLITLSNPYPELPGLLAHPAMAALPMHRITAIGDAWARDRPIIASGPYRLTQWQLNTAMVLSRNPNWHDEPAPITKIRWQPMDDKLSAMRLILTKAADIAASYPDNRHQWLIENHPDLVHEGEYLGTYYYAFNTRRPPFDDVRVRRALAMAVDKQWITDRLIALGNKPAYRLVPAFLYGNRPATILHKHRQTPAKTNMQTARTLLQRAGYGPDNPLRFDIRINSAGEHRRIAVALSAMWAQIGVEAQILNTEATLHFASLRTGDFAFARSGWIADLPSADNFLSIHRSDAGSANYSGYANPQYDALLDQAKTATDPAERISLLQKADDMLMRDAPILPLYYYNSRTLVAPRVAGWQSNPLNIHPSATLSFKP